MKIDKELNGYDTNTKQLLAGFAALKDDGSTTCASWIYSGMYPRRATTGPPTATPDADRSMANLGWGFAWPANRRIMYNRASAKPDGTALERAQEVGLVGRRPEEVGRQRRARLLR